MVEEEQGWIEANPCDALPRRMRPEAGKSRDHVPSLAELKSVWAAVEDESMRDLVRFLLLVPLRRDEAAGLSWSEVDLDRKRIVVAADRMKNGEAHELPLAEQAFAILAARRPAKVRPGALVFPSGEGKPFDGWNRLLTRIRKALEQGDAGHDARFNIHDVRRGFATHLAERFDENLLDLMLAHRPASRSGSGAAYQKAKRLNERPAVMAAWAGIVTGEAEASPPNVVSFSRAG